VAQEQLREPVASPHQVDAEVLAGADQIPHRLLGRAWDADGAELARQEQADQVLGIAAVGLDPVGRAAGDLSRGGDQAVDLGRGQSPGEPIAGRPGLIGCPHRAGQRSAKLDHRSALAAEPRKAQLAGL